ncbi:MAG: 3-isopropylmalate dehydratase large subunit [Candidatus Heimdallarchaeota archaeon]|nr:3-isopropylmalate dehydratase large subunit [Candidatus Heimdallarchaeota archaeon]
MIDQTISEKILSRQSIEQVKVEAGDRVDIKPNTVLTNEMLSMLGISKFYQTGAKKVNPDIAANVLTILDHGGFGTTEKYVDLHQATREFSKQHQLKLMDVGSGISHIVYHEMGYARPGYLILGTDSHTCTHGAFNAFAKGIGASDLVELLVKGTTWLDVPHTYKINLTGTLRSHVYSKDIILAINGLKKMNWATDRAIEWTGSTIADLSIESRLTMTNMAVEQGAVTGIMPYDNKTKNYLQNLPVLPEYPVKADSEAFYEQELDFEVTELEPMVAAPHSPDNVSPVSEIGVVELDQVFIGSCTNARIEDLEVVARILKGKKVKTRTIIIPGSHQVGLEAARRGFVEIFLEAGATFAYSTCGACFGGSLGRIGPGDTVISTTNRNFIGRMGGDESSKVYLSSPGTAASSAVAGIISSEGI